MIEMLRTLQASDTTYRLGWTLLNSLWLGAAIAAALAAVLTMLRGKSSQLRYAAACTALVLLLAGMAWTFSLVPQRPEIPRVQESMMQPEGDTAVVPPVGTVASLPMANRDATGSVAAPEPRAAVAGADEPLAAKAQKMLEPVIPWVVLGWIAGVFILSVWQVSVWMAARRLCMVATQAVDKSLLEMVQRLKARLRISRPVRVTRSMLAQVPMTIGWMRPVILLPASLATGLSTSQLETLLVHELAHIRRLDYLVNLMQTLIETLMFYHPAVWYIGRRIRAERENCCDDMVVQICGGREEYAHALMVCSGAGSQLAMAASGGRLLPRIRRILGLANSGATPSTLLSGALALILIAVMVVVPIACSLSPKKVPADITPSAMQHVRILSGQILSPDGKKIGGAKLSLCREDLDESPRVLRTVIASVDGTFQIPLKEEESSAHLFLFADAPDYALSGDWVNADAPVQIHLLPATELTLPLVGPDGKHAAGVRVRFDLIMTPDDLFGAWPLPTAIQQQFAATSGANGVATLSRLPRGYKVRPQIDDERFAQLTFPNPMVLSDDAVTSGNVLHLAPAATVQGKVTFGLTGEPAVGIRVAAQGNGTDPGWGEAITDAQGRYVIKQLPAVHYNVALDLRGALGQSWTAVAHEDLALVAGQHVLNMDFSLIKGALITGKLVAQGTGEPAAGVSIGVYGPAHPESSGWVQTTDTDKDGAYVLRVPPGPQHVYVQSPLPPTLDAAGPTEQRVDVKDGQELTVDFPLARPPPAQAVSGQVLDADGKSAVHATVVVDMLRRPGATSIQTDTDGRFQISGAIVSGGAILRAQQGGQITVKSQRVEGGEQVTLRLFRDPYAIISGTVVGQDGKAVANADVPMLVFTSDERIPERMSTTDAQGRYHFANVRPDADYVVYAFAKGFAAAQQVVKDLAPQEKREVAPLVLKAADTTGAEDSLVTPPTQPTTGAATTEFNSPLALTVLVRANVQSVFQPLGVTPAPQPLEIPAGSDWVVTPRADTTTAALAAAIRTGAISRVRLPSANDDDLAALAGLTGLRELILDQAPITAAGMVHLKGLTGLQILSLEEANITGASLENLNALSDLRTLNLSVTKVGDAGLAQLRSLTALRELNLFDAGVTDVGLAQLDGLTNLQALNIGNAKLSGTGLAHLRPLSSLRELNLLAANIADGGWAQLENLPALQKLNLALTNITDADLAHLQNMHDLRDLDLTNTAISDAGLQHLQGLGNLQKLAFAATQTTDVGLKGLEGLSKLRSLWLSENITDAGMKYLAGFPELTELRLSQTKITDAGMASLEGLTKLQELELNETGVTDAGLAHIKGLTAMRTLDLSQTKVSDTGMPYIQGMTGLQSLRLLETTVGDPGVKFLRGMSHLQSLSLSESHITDAGLVDLAGLTDLQMLDLAYTHITDAGLRSLENLRQLQVLFVFETDITDEGLAHLKGLTELQRLFLGGTKITDAGLSQLAGLAGLQSLDLENTHMTDASLAQIKNLRSLHSLDLAKTQVTGVSLGQLKDLAALNGLVLNGTKLTDAGFAQLVALKSLTHLQLSFSTVTDAQALELKNLTGLQQLALFGTTLNGATVQALRAALPNCTIYQTAPKEAASTSTPDGTGQISAAAATEAGNAPWGPPTDGLRCRWIPPQGPITLGTRPEVTVEIENAGKDQILWQCSSQMTWMVSVAGVTPSKSMIMPRFTIATGDGTRLATEGEVRTKFGLAPQFPKGGSTPMPGFYALSPGGKLRLHAAVPEDFPKPGRYQLDCQVARLNLMTNVDYPAEKGLIVCPPMVVGVIAKGAATVPTEDPTHWSAGEWGPVNDGMQVRLNPEKTFLNPGASIPGLFIDARNTGHRAMHLIIDWQHIAIEADGVFYYPQKKPEASVAQPRALGPGNRWEGLPFDQFNAGDYQDSHGKPLAFGPGKHTVQLILTAKPDDPNAPIGEPYHLQTNAMQLPSADQLPYWNPAAATRPALDAATQKMLDALLASIDNIDMVIEHQPPLPNRHGLDLSTNDKRLGTYFDTSLPPAFIKQRLSNDDMRQVLQTLAAAGYLAKTKNIAGLPWDPAEGYMMEILPRKDSSILLFGYLGTDTATTRALLETILPVLPAQAAASVRTILSEMPQPEAATKPAAMSEKEWTKGLVKTDTDLTWQVYRDRVMEFEKSLFVDGTGHDDKQRPEAEQRPIIAAFFKTLNTPGEKVAFLDAGDDRYVYAINKTIYGEYAAALLKDDNAAVRSGAVHGLGYNRLTQYRKEVTEMLRDPDVDVRIQTLTALACFGEHEQAEQMQKIASTASDERERVAALEAIGLLLRDQEDKKATAEQRTTELGMLAPYLDPAAAVAVQRVVLEVIEQVPEVVKYEAEIANLASSKDAEVRRLSVKALQKIWATSATQPATQPATKAALHSDWLNGMWIHHRIDQPGPTEPTDYILELEANGNWRYSAIWGTPQKPTKAVQYAHGTGMKLAKLDADLYADLSKELGSHPKPEFTLALPQENGSLIFLGDLEHKNADTIVFHMFETIHSAFEYARASPQLQESLQPMLQNAPMWNTDAPPGADTQPDTQPMVEFSGHVVDDQTGKPVERFMLESGWSDDPKDPDKIGWGGMTEMADRRPDGSFSSSTGWEKAHKLWLRVVADGYLPQPVTPEPVTSPAKVENLVVRLKRGQVLRGTILDHAGKPVAGAQIFVAGNQRIELDENANAFSAKSSFVTGKEGHFTITGVSQKDQQLLISAPALYAWLVTVTDPSKEATITLPEPASLAIHYNIAGAPKDGEFYLELMTWDMPQWKANAGVQRKPIVANGQATTITGLTPGKYDLVRSKTLRVGDAGGSYLCDRRTITLEAGKQLETSFIREKGAPVAGKVEGLKAAVMPGAIIFVRSAEATGDPRADAESKLPMFDALTCGIDGTFKTELLLPGTYTVVVEAYGPDKFPGNSGIRLPDFLGTAKVTVPENGNPEPVKIQIKPLADTPAPTTAPTTRAAAAPEKLIIDNHNGNVRITMDGRAIEAKRIDGSNGGVRMTAGGSTIEADSVQITPVAQVSPDVDASHGTKHMEATLVRIEGDNLIVTKRAFPIDAATTAPATPPAKSEEITIDTSGKTTFILDGDRVKRDDLQPGVTLSITDFGDSKMILANSKVLAGKLKEIDGKNLILDVAGKTVTVPTDDNTAVRFIAVSPDWKATDPGKRTLADLKPGMRLHVIPDTGTAKRISTFVVVRSAPQTQPATQEAPPTPPTSQPSP